MEILYDNHIDFDESSREWRKNKVSIGNGYFVYKCQYIHTNRKICNKPIHQNERYSNHPDRYTFCKKHLLVSKYKKQSF